ncbi:PREDICTED: core-binding factor subunit beta [Bison bison bison]|uniref:Core-binding factor subunit beta n=1 Tax=Bison bison bison TaxID=43346 RepID=A0A6P3IEU2_BISBB|nr:PREDICTED: core-binding factor subunit beta [Bison bison bison]
MMRVQLDLFSLFPPLVFDVHNLHPSWSVFGISKNLSFQRRLWSLLQSLQGLKFPGVQVTIWGYSALLGSPKIPGSVEEGLVRAAPYLQERGRSPTERSGRPGEKGPRGAAGGAGFRCSPAAPQADLRRMRGAGRRVVNGAFVAGRGGRREEVAAAAPGAANVGSARAIKYTGFRDRPHEERQARFQNACRDGRSEIAFVATGTNLSLQFFPASWQGEQRQTPSREYVDFEREAGKVYLKAPMILNGVCVIWKGWIDLQRLDGMGCLEFDEERAQQEDALAQQAFEEARRRTREFEDRDRSHREEMEARRQQDPSPGSSLGGGDDLKLR